MDSKILGERKEGLVFVVSAPAGTGKTTLVEMLMAEFPEVIASISWTTRKPRSGEQEGLDYHFVSREVFETKIKQNEFLEYVELYGDYYGTDRKWIQEQLQKGKHVVLVIDTQGAQKIRGNIPATFIFIRPPSLGVLRRRLEVRKTDTQEAIERRLVWAELELKRVHEYDYELVNDDLGTAYQILRSIVIAACHAVNKSRSEKV